jgi:hypothetical protein
LLLAMIDLPDFGTPLRSIAGSVERIAEKSSSVSAEARPSEEVAAPAASVSEKPAARVKKEEVHSHA